MRQCIISLLIAIVTVVLALIEMVTIGFAWPCCTREWLAIILPSVVVVIIAVSQIALLEKKRKILATFGGGMLLVFFIYTALRAIYFFPRILDALPPSDGALYLLVTFLGFCYVPMVYVAAFWLYFHVYINIKKYQI